VTGNRDMTWSFQTAPELWAGVVQGDGEALHDLTCQLRRRAARMLLKRGRPRSGAEDLAQEVMMDLVKFLKSPDRVQLEKLPGFVQHSLKCALFVPLAQRRVRMMALRDDQVAPTAGRGQMELQEMIEVIRRALSAFEALVFELACLKGLSIEECSEMLFGCHARPYPRKVRASLWRIREKARDRFPDWTEFFGGGVVPAHWRRR